MLGMIIGVAAVITMVALGTGAQAAIEDQIRGAGTNMIMVFPGAATVGRRQAGRRHLQQADAGRRRGAAGPAGRRVRDRSRAEPAAGHRRREQLAHVHRRRQRGLSGDQGMADEVRRRSSPTRTSRPSAKVCVLGANVARHAVRRRRPDGTGASHPQSDLQGARRDDAQGRRRPAARTRTTRSSRRTRPS